MISNWWKRTLLIISTSAFQVIGSWNGNPILDLALSSLPKPSSHDLVPFDQKPEVTVS